MHKDALHHGGVEHRDMHNLNGALFHNATVQGLTQRGKAVYGSDGDRPFVLSRAFFAGSQRIGPIWTGDNAATWEQLRVSVPMLLSINMAGLSFAGVPLGLCTHCTSALALVKYSCLCSSEQHAGHRDICIHMPGIGRIHGNENNCVCLACEHQHVWPVICNLYIPQHMQQRPAKT